MARYVQDAGINQPLDVVSDVMEQYIYRNRYIRTDWKGELVYLSTDSAAKGSRYLVWSYTSGILHIEAWLKGAFEREAGLTGAGGKKRAYKESIDNLIETLRHPVKDEYTRSEAVYQQQAPVQTYTPKPYTPPYATPQKQEPPVPPYGAQQQERPVPPYGAQQQERSVPPYGAQQQTPVGQSSAQQSHTPSGPVYTENWMGGKQSSTPNSAGNSFNPTQSNASGPYVPDYREEKAQKARKGLTFGIAAVVTSFIIPIIGLIFGIIGLGDCREGMESDMADKAKIGKALCIIAIVWCFMRMLYFGLVMCVGMFSMF